MFFILSKTVGFLLMPSNFLVLLVLVGLLLMATRLRRRGAQLVALAGLGFVVGAYTPLSTLLLLPLENRFQRPAFASTDMIAGIVILGGAEEARTRDRRSVVAVSDAAERFIDAAALARRFPKARIVFSGGSGELVAAAGDNAETAREALLAMGVEDARIVLERSSRNTAENAAFTKALVRPADGERWLLVTSAWHMPRSVGCFRRVGWDIEPWPVDYRTSSWEDLFGTPPNAAEGLRQLDFTVREWIGLVAYYVTGRIDTLFPGPNR